MVISLIVCRPHSHRHKGRDSNLPSTAHLRRQRPRTRLDPALQTIQINQALPAERLQISRCMFPSLPKPSNHYHTDTSTNNYRRASRTANRPLTARSWTASTNASCASAARPRARHTGGIQRNTSVPPSCCNPTAGSPTRETNAGRSARPPWITR